MTDKELEDRLRQLIKNERKITYEILELIREAERRKIHIERGYSNLYDWLVRGFGYSQAAAYRRVQAARLLKEVPEAQEKIENGSLNLTTVAQLQGAVMKEERRIGEKFDAGIKRLLVSQIENKSPEQTSKILSHYFPEAVAKKESFRSVSSEQVRLTVTFDDQDAEALKQVRAFLSNACQTWEEVVNWLVKDYLKRRLKK